jgi:hypothetical protein
MVKSGIMNTLTSQDLITYLKIYNSDIDWEPYIIELSKQVARRFRNEEQAKEARWKQVACTILLPYYDKSTMTDPPENLLFKCHTYHQFNSRDWIVELEKIFKKDQQIAKIRNEALNLGFVYPIEYNPNTRQAFKWLTDSSKQNGEWVDGYTKHKMENLIHNYGGAVICSVFLKPELKTKIYKLHSWRSGYFFERLIHEVYKPEEILKIKNQEILKIKNSDPKLIKQKKVINTMEKSSD